MEEITIKDVAKLCGVGISTVSRAINNHPDISTETKKRVMEVIQEYGYIPNNSARNLRRTDGKCIAVVIKGSTNPLFSNVTPIMENEIKKRKFSMVVRYVNFDEDELDIALGLAKEKRLDGVIFLGAYFTSNEKRLQKLKIPVILSTSGYSGDGPPAEGYSVFSVDDEKEGYRMTNYLIGLGHEKIAFLLGLSDDSDNGKQRLKGYKRALREHGIAFDEDLIIHRKQNASFYSMENGYTMTKELLESGKEFTCIFAFSDAMAIGACRAITDAGKKVPEDYSVAGFDGIELGNYYNPKLTTIRQPIRQIAQESVDALFEILDNESGHTHKIFTGTLLERESTKQI